MKDSWRFRNEIRDWEKMRNNIPRRKKSDVIKRRNMRHTVNYKRIRCRIARFLVSSLRLLSGVHNDTSIHVYLRWHWLRRTTRNSSFEKAPVTININSNMWRRHLHRSFCAWIACSITDDLSFLLFLNTKLKNIIWSVFNIYKVAIFNVI